MLYPLFIHLRLYPCHTPNADSMTPRASFPPSRSKRTFRWRGEKRGKRQVRISPSMTIRKLMGRIRQGCIKVSKGIRLAALLMVVVFLSGLPCFVKLRHYSIVQHV